MYAWSSRLKRAAALVLALAWPAGAQVLPPLQWSNNNTVITIGPYRAEFPSAAFTVSSPSSGIVVVDASVNVNLGGTVLGDQANEVIFFPGGSTGQVCGSSNQGRHRVLADGSLEWCGDNTTGNVYAVRGPALLLAGGTGTAAFTYAGEVSACSSADTGCARTVCRCGACSGTEGSGTCTLPVNVMIEPEGLSTAIFPMQFDGGVYEFSSVAISAGTVTLGLPAAPGTVTYQGQTLGFRVTGDFSLTGTGSILMRGRGAPFNNVFGLADCNATAYAGGGSFNSRLLPGSPGGPNTGADTATAGTSASAAGPLPTSLLGLNRLFWGTAGGSRGDNLSSTAGRGLATGGGGGGCTTGCASGKTGIAGAGGGYVYVETRGTYTCTSSATRAYDLRGIDGQGGATGCSGGVACQSGGGGGGGGSLVVLTKALGTNTCAVSATGGAGGVAQSASCGDGAAGGNGAAFVRLIPG